MAVNHKTTKAATKPEVFDLTGTLRRLGGDTTLLSDLVQLYGEDSPALLNRLQLGVENQRAEEVRHAAHSLRGLAANFGAAVLTQSLLQLEETAAKGQLEQAAPLVNQISEESRRLLATLSVHRR